MKPLILLAPFVLALAACQPAETEAPTAPADTPVEVPPPPGATTSVLAPLFAGTWAADPAWCENPSGAERPIVLTETRFEGYENSCVIGDLATTDVGWTATFTCSAEGQTTTEPVAIEASAETLEINWINQGGQSVEWRRCPEA